MGDYINTLDSSYPDGTTHKVFVLDDDARDTKKKIKTTFPNITGAVTASHTELNTVDGVTSNVQTQINTLNDRYGVLNSKGVVYRGRVAANGVGLVLPAGWTSNFASNVYTIQHSLGGNSAYPSVTIDSSTNSEYWKLGISTQSTHVLSFTVQVFNVKTGAISSAGFYFILHHIP